MQLEHEEVNKIIVHALEEDIRNGDITSLVTIPEGKKAEFVIRARHDMISCGEDIICRVFKIVDADIEVTSHNQDGDKLSAGDSVISGKGNARSILAAERVALNLIRQMFGVATLANKFVEKTRGTKAKILDTRKTIPGLRVLQKYAVKAGGATNHRFCLDDGILIKDNHISVCGGIKEALEQAKSKAPPSLDIEIECDTLEQVADAVKYGADIILLDNMTIEQTIEAVKIADGKVLLEASGNVNLETVEEIAKTGVDFISSGMITNSPLSVDVGLDMDF